MDGVAAEIAEEIPVFLQHGDPNSGAAKQVAEHHSGRAAANDAAGCFYGFHKHILIGRAGLLADHLDFVDHLLDVGHRGRYVLRFCARGF